MSDTMIANVFRIWVPFVNDRVLAARSLSFSLLIGCGGIALPAVDPTPFPPLHEDISTKRHIRSTSERAEYGRKMNGCQLRQSPQFRIVPVDSQVAQG
jgi:hypothetical protein